MLTRWGITDYYIGRYEIDNIGVKWVWDETSEKLIKFDESDFFNDPWATVATYQLIIVSWRVYASVNKVTVGLDVNDLNLTNDKYFPLHDEVIKWKHFPRYWPFARGIHRSPVDSPHKGQWREALVFYLIYAWTNDLANNREMSSYQNRKSHCGDKTVVRSSNLHNGISRTSKMASLYWFSPRCSS